MRLRPEQLPAGLRQRLLPLYLVSGEETLLVQEACDAIRAAARQAGCDERQILEADGHFDWDRLRAASAAMSLFAERRLLELRMPSGKPGAAGGKALLAYLENPAPGNVLLIVAGKLERAATASKWFKALDSAGAIVQVWAVERERLPRWLEGRARQLGLSIDPDALQLLCDRVEGNLLAAAQELEKLRLLSASSHISADTVHDTVTDSARYNLFAMVDHALAGQAAAAIRMLNGLRAEGAEAAVMLWAVSKELRVLCQCRQAMDSGRSAAQAMQELRVWQRRRPALGGALSRHATPGLAGLVELAAATDQAIKGMSRDDPWRGLAELLLKLAGH